MSASAQLVYGEWLRGEQRRLDAREQLRAAHDTFARIGAEGDGHTNPAIGAQLFISPRTVEFHLHKVFAKLGISSRKELREALPHGEYGPVPT